MKNKRRLYGAILLAGCLLGPLGCEKSERAGRENKDKAVLFREETESAWQEAASTPYGRYPELVTYTLCQMSGANNSNLPQGATYEDNEYTKYLKKVLNIQNVNAYMEKEDRYDEYVNVLVKDRNLPDILVLNSRETLKELVESDMLEDLGAVYESCTSKRIKEMYDSYGGELLEAGTFDGKLLALPEAVIDHGPCLLWLRKDWMEELGLAPPGNMEEAIAIIRTFMENRMGAEEGEDPIGLVCATSLVGTTSESYSVDPVFDLYGAHPKRWVEDADGELVYGSLTQETKEAISFLRDLCRQGILDQSFALRAQNNLRDLVVEGKCGAFFGLWWSPNNPLMDALEENPQADWEPYYLTAGQKDETQVYNSFRDNKYVVVRKGYEHPEIVMKIISVLFDYSRYEAEDAEDINSYFGLNVNPTARPLVINVDYNEATYTVTKNIRRAMEGRQKEEELSAIEKSYYDACVRYVKGTGVSSEDWAAYKSRISAVGLLVDAGYQPPKPKYLAESDGEMTQLLEGLERDAFIQLIMGRQPMSYFDTFVREWYAQGGAALTKKIRQENP